MINDFLRAQIKSQFQEMKEKDPSYSLRAHAQELGISPGSYSEFVSGRRRISDKKALDIARKLKLDPAARELLEQLASSERVVLHDDDFQMIKDWHYFAILSLLECHSPPTSSMEISQRLGLSKDLTESSIQKLIDLKLLLKNSDGSLSITGLSYFTNDGIPSTVIRSAHHDGLKLAAKAIDEIATDERDFTYLTFSGNSRQIAKAKKEVRRCLDKVSQIMGHSQKDQVYRLSIQLFPLVKAKESV